MSQSKLADDLKRGKTCASEPRLVILLLLIGRESGAGEVFRPIMMTKRSSIKPKETRITFDTRDETTLSIQIGMDFFVGWF